MRADPEEIYRALDFPAAPANRPYVYVDMVATIDGKILSGDRDETVVDLGSKLDHQLVRRIEHVSDAVLVGARTLRATSPKWKPAPPVRIVVSKSGNLPTDALFFSSGAYIAAPQDSKFDPPAGVKVLHTGTGAVDFEQLLRQIRDLGVQRLFVLGGSHVNGQLLRMGLVDELFLTIAPKVKLGENVPTYAGGDAFPRSELPRFNLVEHHVVEDEVFLRYRRAQS